MCLKNMEIILNKEEECVNVPKRKKKSKKNKSKYVPQRYVSVRVRVPECTVGLVVGPCGQTIQQIQHATNTFIKAPTRLQEPIFEITGLKFFVKFLVGQTLIK